MRKASTSGRFGLGFISSQVSCGDVLRFTQQAAPDLSISNSNHLEPKTPPTPSSRKYINGSFCPPPPPPPRKTKTNKNNSKKQNNTLLSLPPQVFWWKFFLCTDVRVFPEPRQFHPSEAIARWSVQTDDKGRQYFKVLGLGKDPTRRSWSKLRILKMGRHGCFHGSQRGGYWGGAISSRG